MPDDAAGSAPVIETGTAPPPPSRAGLLRRLLREPGTAIAALAAVLAGAGVGLVPAGWGA